MKKWFKDGDFLVEPSDEGQRFGVYHFDDDSFYLGEFDDYKRNGMGMQSLEDGDYFFGYFGDVCNVFLNLILHIVYRLGKFPYFILVSYLLRQSHVCLTVLGKIACLRGDLLQRRKQEF